MSANIREVGASADEQIALNGLQEFKVSAWGYRHQQGLILFFTLTIAYSMKSSMGVALVAMTTDNLKLPDIATTDDVNHGAKNINSVNINSTWVNASYVNEDDEYFKAQGFFNALMFSPPYPTFKWNKKVQAAVMSSFFWGYTILQIPAGQLAHRFGAINLLTGTMMINCIVSAFIPLAALYGGWICTAIFRFIQGLSQAFIAPSMHMFFGKWARLEERGRLTSVTYGGVALGTVLGILFNGFISSSSMGWPGIFRVYALLSGIIAGFIWWFGADTPANHPKITAAERKYIESGLNQKAGYDKRQLPVPWAKIITSPGVFAIVIAHIGHVWGHVTLYSEVPAFMDKVMGVNIKANGMLTALPFIVMWFTNFFFSWFTDMLIVKKVMSVTNVRKLANCTGTVTAALGLIVLAFVPKNIYIVETILVIICGFKVSAQVGYQVNHIDISPNFAGTLMSLSNFAANAFGSLAPIVTGFILTDVKNEYLWRQVFFVTAGFYFFTNLLYVILGTGEMAEWNDPDFKKINKGTNSEENEAMLNKMTEKV